MVTYLSGCVRDSLPSEVGVMLTPMMGNRVPEDRLWAADTGCFAAPLKHDDDRYLDWLRERAALAGRCLFATAPDVLGDGAATLARSAPMLARIRRVGFRAALVAQDGMERLEVPWDEIDALFLGGSTGWKLGTAAAGMACEARRRGKHVHMGRVNSLRRLRHAQAVGCHSADGTFVAFGPNKNIPRVERWLRAMREHPMLEELA